MSGKKMFLFITLSALSALTGISLGLLDIYGFIDGRHTLSISLLLSSIVLTYFILINVYILHCAEKSRVGTFFILASVVFSLTFYLMSFNVLLTLISGFLYLYFLHYAHDEGKKRSELYISFRPQEIIFPILKNSLSYLMIMIAIIAFAQSQKLVEQNSLITPSMLKMVMKPGVVTLNKQLNSQIESEIGDVLRQARTQRDKEKIVRAVLSATINEMGKNDTIYGFRSDEIPIEKTVVYEGGSIDIAPVLEAMLPDISEKLNNQINTYAVFAPFAIAFLVILILQPFLFPIQFIEKYITSLIFIILLKTSFIKITKKQVEVDVISF